MPTWNSKVDDKPNKDTNKIIRKVKNSCTLVLINEDVVAQPFPEKPMIIHDNPKYLMITTDKDFNTQASEIK